MNTPMDELERRRAFNISGNKSRRIGGEPASKTQAEPENIPVSHDPVSAVITDLINLPGQIMAAELAAAEIERQYETALAQVTREALGVPMFKGKNDTLNMAGNDQERKIAVTETVARHTELIPLINDYNDSTARLSMLKRQWEAATLIATLVKH